MQLAIVVIGLAVLWVLCGFAGAGIKLAFDIRWQSQPLLFYRLAASGEFIVDILRGPRILYEELKRTFFCGWHGFLIPDRRAGLEAFGRQHTMCRALGFSAQKLRPLLP